MKRVSLLVSVLLGCAACDGGAAGVDAGFRARDSGDRTDEDGGTLLGDDGGALPGDDGGTLPGDDGGTLPGDDAGTGTPDGGGGSGSTDLYPLAVGHRWDYAINRGSRPGCDEDVVSTTITATGADGSDTWYQLEMSCGSYPTSQVKRVGGDVYVRSGTSGAWYLQLSLPPSEGAEWAAGGASGARYRWTSVPSVTLPAGSFSGCWRRDQIGYDNFEVYCPGVGMVSADFFEWQSEGYDLTSRNF